MVGLGKNIISIFTNGFLFLISTTFSTLAENITQSIILQIYKHQWFQFMFCFFLYSFGSNIWGIAHISWPSTDRATRKTLTKWTNQDPGAVWTNICSWKAGAPKIYSTKPYFCGAQAGRSSRLFQTDGRSKGRSKGFTGGGGVWMGLGWFFLVVVFCYKKNTGYTPKIAGFIYSLSFWLIWIAPWELVR